MASNVPALSTDCYDTALCIIPPKDLWTAVDHLRSVYDPAYKEWPPHINLVYPFVPIHSLQKASELIISRLQEAGGIDELGFDLLLRLQTTGIFYNQGTNLATFFRHDKNIGRTSELKQLRKFILNSLQVKQTVDDRIYMTIGKSKEGNNYMNKYTVKKLNLLRPLHWKINKLYILIRDEDESRINKGLSSQMKIWGEIDLSTLTLLRVENPIGFYKDEEEGEDEGEMDGYTTDGSHITISAACPLTRLPYTFSPAQYRWIKQEIDSISDGVEAATKSLAIASYNIQAEIRVPPTRARYSIIIQNILDKQALADVLVLEEVTDDFLSRLCKDRDIRENYPFFSSGPPDQIDVEPLPAHTNVVVLSKWPFSWDLLLLPSGQRGSVIVQFDNIGKQENGVFIPVVLSAIHLTSGLTNISIKKKRQELVSVLNYLSNKHPWNPWILAGDLNIHTSSYTIETAARRKDISSRSQSILFELEEMLVEAGLVDTWVSSCVRYGGLPGLDRSQHDTNALGGEAGATFDPTVNDLAADSAPESLDKRPQRHDRILTRWMDFTVTGFSMFGQDKRALLSSLGADTNNDSSGYEFNEQLSYGSDHWGVRCSLDFSTNVSGQALELEQALPAVGTDPTWPIENASGLAACLSNQPEFPSEIDVAMRETALNLLREIVLQDEDSRARGLPTFVIVPVGSYGLGVWTTTSDINCLCIGPISSDVFFTLAIQRLIKAASRGVKILRRVDTQFGTVLELEVGHIKMDLQYCSATTIAETWPRALTLPPTDPIFELPSSVLVKLKPLRDLCHLQRTVPDLAVFKLAHRFITFWAKRRGIYAAKFGYLGGIQISILLSRVYNLLSCRGRSVSAPTLLTAFYIHYAGLNWKEHIVFDSLFHKTLRYVRTAQEPMSILGFYGPNLNTAQAASGPTVHVISKEFERALTLLSRFVITWPDFLGEDTGATEFLNTYKAYIKITPRFWGVSLAKGNGFVEWLESRCVSLLADLSKQVPEMSPRIWPARFINQDAPEEATEYEGHYLVGLKMENSQGKVINKKDGIAALERIRAVLYKFENQIVSDPKHFDPKSYWMGITIVTGSEVKQLRLDDRDWGKYTLEAEADDIGDSKFWASMEAEELNEPQTKKEPAVKPPIRPAYEGKFRPAGNVLNRLRWDQGIDSGDYIVGYEDRFSGAMERPVDLWKSETTHEEFIPEHRILYFKRKSDGTTVWDKEERRDEIFGSGVTSLGHQARG
ncbi:hypothetical protein F4781DRAFT_204909 [Annulohypoxylon bovei var. microspora]|nr:hypothetical protein F4781DRAFT_204909 [Annulohypoxylon bovei var. microspora]